ncbi:STAS domain-containing protein [Cronbergia sp. UHCC 0137]|uniref:STAS domain-containing protein n=1 Tax=Cronbergia sp. UHCC 0137 TaxID=3110239 RepID=UPI002B20CF93|nr:STAS domain-containing protein [Cronbergia sp. UHCC 0137]MEA5619032.1 STAS domain-containing protein [Cronbergia sp. UHCC 0137]
MAFTATLETIGDIAKITVSGELDANTAPDLKAKIEEAVKQHPKRLVFIMEELEYMASAGLRMLIFAKQQMGAVDIYIVGAQENVLDTIQKTGFDQSVYLLDKYDAEKIETV